MKIFKIIADSIKSWLLVVSLCNGGGGEGGRIVSMSKFIL